MGALDNNGILRGHGNISNENREYSFSTIDGHRYHISHGNMTSFYQEYCESLSKILEDNPDGDLFDDENGIRSIGGIIQCPSETSPVIIDMSLKFSPPPFETYSEDFIINVIYYIQQAILQTYNIPEENVDDDIFMGCVFMSWQNDVRYEELSDNDSEDEGGSVETRLRFQFPYINVYSRTLGTLRKLVVSMMRENNTLARLDQIPLNWENSLVVHSDGTVPLYGSSDKYSHPALILDRIYGLIDIDEGLDQPVYDIGDFFDWENHALVRTGIIDSTLRQHYDDNILLPLYLNNGFQAKIMSLLDENNTPVNNNDLYLSNSRILVDKTETEFCELLNLVSKERFLSQNSWEEIGKALLHSYDGSPDGLNYWISYTTKALSGVDKIPLHLKSDGYSVADLCTFAYESFPIPGNVTFRTIVWFAMKDSPVAYTNWHKKWADPYYDEALSNTDTDIAKALFCETFLTWACASPSKNIVYEFRKCRWVHIDGGYKLRNYISGPFKRKFEQFRSALCTHALQTLDENLKERYEKKIKAVGDVIKTLKSRTRKNSILKEVLDLLTIEGFEDALNSNPNLTGHPNGVTEVNYNEKSIKFREGKPEDYLSKITACRMKIDYKENHPHLIKFDRWMEQMFVDVQTRHFVMKIFASLFIAGNYDKLVFLFTGDYNNGKSCISKLLLHIWGNYVVKCPPTCLTRSEGNYGSANPAASRQKNTRLVELDEPEKGESFKTGPFKASAGNDAKYERSIYKEGGEQEGTCTYFLFCNTPPSFHDPDKASTERLCAVPCKSTYNYDVPENIEEQIEKRLFRIDPNFIHVIGRLASAALYRSYQYFPIWCEEGLKNCFPPEVELANKKYWEQNDIYQIYINDRLESTGDTSDYLEFNIMYNDFEIWYSRYYDRKNLPSRDSFRTELISRFNGVSPADNIWYNITFKNKEDINLDINNSQQTYFNNPINIKPSNRPIDSNFDMELLMKKQEDIEGITRPNNVELINGELKPSHSTSLLSSQIYEELSTINY